MTFILALASSCGSAPDEQAAGSGDASSSGSDGTGGVSTNGSGSGGKSSGTDTGTGTGTSTSTSTGTSTSSGMSSSTGGPMPCMSDADCDDHLYCTGTESCNAGMCAPGAQPNCDDSLSCTDDFCDEAQTKCQHVVNDNNCSDGQFCNGTEKCDPPNGAPMTGCRAGAPPNCNDGVDCTVDACDEAQKACAHTPSKDFCIDGFFCNGDEVCDPLKGCVAGVQVACDDGLSCTFDSCSEVQKQCLHVPNDAACDDGFYCNGVESCSDPGASPTGCAAGAPVLCPIDSIPCTNDVCDELTKGCVHIADNNNCPSGQFCVIQQNGCTSGMPCMNSGQCQDNNLCNGVETCVAGICQPGAQVTCDDGIECTVDTCTPATGNCKYTPNDDACDDGFACNGIDSCDPLLGCVKTPPIDCNDGIACTVDACQEPDGTCEHAPDNTACSDGKLCNGIEVCDPPIGNPLTGCKPGAPFVCPSDGIACTDDVCDPVLNQCVHTPKDNLCPCAETCDPQQGCGHFCNIATCQGNVHQCGDCLDNDGDCKIDSADDQCLGPCDNTEDSFYGSVAGQNNPSCKVDCYFDANNGSGNDDCYWSHQCDPLEMGPNYPPEGMVCAYDMNASTPGTNQSCSQLSTAQSAQCLSYCGPITPNGCDCFGCCAIPGAPTTVWLGSESAPGTGTCNVNTLNDASKCKPCTQVVPCLNPCDTCELCVGKSALPLGCAQQSCDNGAQRCGLVGQAQCPLGYSCITGCCQHNPG